MGKDPADKLEPPRLALRRTKSQRGDTPEPKRDTPAPKGDTPEPKERPAARPGHLRKPQLPTGHAATALVGLAVGAFLVLAVWVCQQLSQQARGTTSFGRAGWVLLLGIFLLAVVGGTALLRLVKTRSAGTVSFLGTGLVAVLAMLLGSGHLDRAWTAPVVVIGTGATFVLARWVTIHVIDAAPRTEP